MSSFNKSDIKIILVDDSDFFRSHLIQKLSDADYNVIGDAPNAQQALKLIKEKKPDIVITDIVMPEESGIELTEKISALPSSPAVIIISSLNHEQIVLQAITVGASDFIQKPISFEQLEESIEKIVINKNK